MSRKTIDTSDLPYTGLPNKISNPMLKSDITSSDLAVMNQYNAYLAMGTENGLLLAKQYMIEHPEIVEHIITADDILKLSHDNVALQRMFFEDIENYIMSVVSFKGNYDPATPYKRYDVVLYDGLAYFCYADTEAGILPTDESYFYPLTLKGIQGEPGVDFVAMGVWNPEMTYSANHAVSWNGALWYSVEDFNAGNEPNDLSAHWKKFMVISQSASDVMMNDGTSVQDTIDDINSEIEDISSNISTFDSIYAQKSDLDFLETIVGEGVPTTSTQGLLRQYYKDSSTGDLYECVEINDGEYTWRKLVDGNDPMEPAAIYKFATSTSTSGYPNISTIDHRYFVIDVGDNNILKYYDVVSSSWKPIVSVWS